VKQYKLSIHPSIFICWNYKDNISPNKKVAAGAHHKYSTNQYSTGSDYAAASFTNTVSDMSELASIYLAYSRLPLVDKYVRNKKNRTWNDMISVWLELAGIADLLHDDGAEVHYLQVFISTIDQTFINHLTTCIHACYYTVSF